MSLINMYAEPTPQGPRAYELRPRPNLLYETGRLDAPLNAGPVHLIDQDGNDTYVLSDTEVFRNGVKIGDVASGGYTQCARSLDQFVMVSGLNAYLVTTVAVTLIGDPDLPPVTGVVFSQGRFVYAGIDNTYYYSEIGDATDIDPLSFASAESQNDNIVRILNLGDELAVMGSRSLEMHAGTVSADLPFRRVQGRTQNIGLASPYSAAYVDNGIFFIGADGGRGNRGVYKFYGGIPERISTPAIDEQLEGAGFDEITSARGIRLLRNGHDMYIFSIEGIGSFAYDVSSGKWAKWESYGKDEFRLRVGDGTYYGDDEGNVLRHGDAYLDITDPVIYTVSCFVPAAGVERHSHLILECLTGVSLASGQGSNAAVEMRYSDDLGGNFTAWTSASLGLIGDYEARAEWRQLGLARRMGRLYEFRCSDPVLFVPYDVVLNPGR